MDLSHDGDGQELQEHNWSRQRCWMQSLSDVVSHALFGDLNVLCHRSPEEGSQPVSVVCTWLLVRSILGRAFRAR